MLRENIYLEIRLQRSKALRKGTTYSGKSECDQLMAQLCKMMKFGLDPEEIQQFTQLSIKTYKIVGSQLDKIKVNLYKNYRI